MFYSIGNQVFVFFFVYLYYKHNYMKNYFFMLTVFLFQQFYGQKGYDERKRLLARELTSSTSKMTSFNVNPNTLNYDLKYQRMDITVDPEVYNISGSVTSHFMATQGMNSIYFDLSDSLTVSHVSYHGSNITFQQLPTKELKIDLPSLLPAGTLDSLTINYSGPPATNTTGFFEKAFSIDVKNGNPVASTLNQPYGAQDWFPTKQSMNDKIDRFDFKITTPSQYSVAANGKFMSETMLPGGTQKVTFWRTMYPTAAYLIAFSITNFVKLNDTIGNPPFPFVNYLYPSTAADPSIIANIDWTKQVMTVFETYLGPYPFRNEKYGHMEFQYNAGGLEHQTMSSIGMWNKQVIAHELAHQWFGDKVTCGAWNDIWLNEGFATFGEHLINEKLLMTNAEFLTYLSGQKNFITFLPGGSTYVSDARLTSAFTTFDNRLTYAKGGYIVRMLKWILGDTTFYQAIRDYHERPNLAYNYARTDDLNASLLQSTGKDFTEFFNDWVYGEGYPTYDIRWRQVGNQITFKTSQTQSSPSVSFFEMPLPIKVIGTNGQVAYLKLNNTSNNQYFTEVIPFTVANIEFNYEYQILEKNSTVIQDNMLSVEEFRSDETFLYPNPAGNELYLKGIKKSMEFTIHFIDGKLIRKETYKPGKGIDISELIPGTYIFSIHNKKIKFLKN